jgi:hypothetical protein
MTTPPPWTVHLGTALETRIHLGLRSRRPGAPWPLPRAITELVRLGAVRDDAPRTLGRGRGMPLLSAQALSWHGLPVYVEVRGEDGAGIEAVLELPSWDEMIVAAPDEDAVWELVDVFAAAVEGGSGVIADGEAPLLAEVLADDSRSALRRHIGVLVAEGSLDPGSAASGYRVLPRSGLEVLLR